MQVFYSDMKLPHPFDIQGYSIFLAGPTPRGPEPKSWRLEALEILRDLGFEGKVLVPERSDWTNCDYTEQVDWELLGLENVGVIVAWVPRKIPTMPAFTTNVEFGMFVNSGRLLYGRPEWAEKTRYLDIIYEKNSMSKPCGTLRELLEQAVKEVERWKHLYSN